MLKKIVNAIVWNNKVHKENKELIKKNFELQSEIIRLKKELNRTEDQYLNMTEMYNETSSNYYNLRFDLERVIETMECVNKNDKTISILRGLLGD